MANEIGKVRAFDRPLTAGEMRQEFLRSGRFRNEVRTLNAFSRWGKQGDSLSTHHTYSRNVGNVDEPQAGPLGDNQIYQDWYNRSLDKGPLANDIVHRFVTVGLWEAAGRARAAFFQHGVLEKVLGGWNLTPCVHY